LTNCYFSTLGWYTALSNPQEYHDAQVPSNVPHPAITPGATVIVLQFGNVLLLLAALAMLCCFTAHPEISRRYLMIVAIADLGHIYSCYIGMGSRQFLDYANYNDMAWGSIGGSAFLFVNRILTVLGIFGQIKNQASKNLKRV
jgi:hypothetical protein